VNVGSSVEWSFDSARVAELRAISAQTGGRELLDLSTAWLRPPFIAETNLRLPLGIALILLIIAEALMTRTGWRLPQFALPQRAPQPKIPKAPKYKPAKAAPVMPQVKEETPSPSPVMEEVDESARRSRFQRAKDRK
jgi:hypothetical protein